MMASVLLPFFMSVLLGRTIDLRTYSTAGNIYDDADYEETSVNKMYSNFAVFQGNAYPYTDMGFPMDVVLRFKSNMLRSQGGLPGMEGFLRDTDWKISSAIVAVTSAYRTVDRTLKEDAKLIPNWQQRIPDSMTHYADNVVYGGWKVALFRFKCQIHGDIQPVRDTLTSVIGAQGYFNNKTVDLMNEAIEAIHANPEIRGKVTIQTRVYSSHPSEHIVQLPSDLTDAISNLPNEVGQLGKPLLMELQPLMDLDEKYATVEEHRELIPQLEQLDELYDDVKNTKYLMNTWLSETLTTFTSEQEKKILELLAHLNLCLRAFHRVSQEVSIYKDMDKSVLEKAFQLYVKGLEADSLTYDQIFRRFKEDIDAECEDSFLPKVKGMLNVTENEVLELGELKGGFEECKTKCLEEQRCRSIGYADHINNLELVGTDGNIGRFEVVKKEKVCWIYFKSTSTATVHLPKGEVTIGVYDRQCY